MSYRLSLSGRVTLIALFLTWGTVSVLLRLTVPHFKTAFELGYSEALLIQSCFFITYLVTARLVGRTTGRIGFGRAAALGLGLMSVGAAGLAATTLVGHFYALLPSVFVLACGVTFLQVAANPLAAAEGATRSAAGNLSFAQAFNSTGTVIGPLIAAAVFLGVSQDPLAPVRHLFYVIAAILLVLALIGASTLHERPLPPDTVLREPVRSLGPFENRRLAAATACIFLYVGAEVAITSTMVNLLESPEFIAVDRATSGRLAAIFWMLMLVGRLGGSWLLVRVPRGRLLAIFSTLTALAFLGSALLDGMAAAVCLLGAGLFCSIHFPTIFAIASSDLDDKSRARAAGWLCTGIVGGAFVPLVYGAVADIWAIQTALLVPVLCFLPIIAFGLYYSDNSMADDRVNRGSDPVDPS